MARPSLLQAIFQQPSQQYVMKEDAYAEPNLKVWRASFPFAHGKDKPVPKHRPLSLDVGQVPELPHEGPPSMTPSPSPTPPLISPASTPKSSTPSFTDETSDSSAEAEFETPPDSPKPSVDDIPQHTVVQETLSPPSLLLSAERPGITYPSPESSSSSANSLFSTRSTDTDATSPQSSPVMSPQSPQSPTKRQVRQTPLSGVPDWAKDVRWLVGHQPAAKRAALSALADPNYRPISQARAATAPARHSSYEPRMADQFGVYVAPPRSSGSRKRRSRAKTEGRRSGYRMSALVEVSEGEEAGEVTAEGIVRKRSTSTQRARPRPHSVRSSSSTSSNRTILPPLQVSETIAGLSLPRTAYTPSRPADRPTNAVDLTKAGLTQSMTSLSVIRGGPSSRMRRISLSLSLNGSASSLSGMSSRNASLSSLGSRSMLGLSSSASIPLAVRLAEIEGALGLTAHMSPSRKVGSSQVLVRVHAVALDALDAIILSKRLAKGGYGFVPGRSFVGRAEECGFEVGNVNRGDWVIGLTEIRKCGALSEYVVIDKSRVCTVPRPTDRLTTTQCALLPLCGVPAHRAVRTIPNSATKTGKDGQQRPMKVLVLQAHDGAGLCAVQVLRQLGMRVTAQVPVGSENVGFGTGPSLGLKARGRTRAGKGREYEPPKSSKRMEEVEVVVGDDPVEVIGRLDEGVYDAVVDTVGGRGVWDACRRVMCKDAHFTTLVGDSTDSIPSINAHVRSSFRSLARAWARKDKGLGYQWVSPAADLDHEGEDVRHSLNAVAEAAARAAYGSPSNSDEDTVEGMLPRVMCSFPFERAQDAFSVDEDGRGPLVYGGTVVVRIL